MKKNLMVNRMSLSWLLVFVLVFSSATAALAMPAEAVEPVEAEEVAEVLEAAEFVETAKAAETMQAHIPPTFEGVPGGPWTLTINEPLTAPQTITIGQRYYTPGNPAGFTGATAAEQGDNLRALFLTNSNLADNFDIAGSDEIITFTLKAPNTNPPIFAYTGFRRPADWWIDASHRGFDAVNLRALTAPEPLWQRPDRVRPLASWHNWANDGTFKLIPTSETWFDVYKLPGDVYVFFEPAHDQEVMSFLIVGTSKAILFDTGMAIGNLRNAVEDVIAIEGLTHLDDLDDPDKFILVHSHTHGDHRADSWRFDTDLYVYDGIDSYSTRRMAKDAMVTSTYTYTPTNPSDLMRDLPQQFLDDIAAAGGRLVRPGVNPDNVKVMKEGDKFDLGGRTLEVVHTPGHTPDSISLIDLGKRVAFTGDWYYSGPNYAYSSANASFGAYHDSAIKINHRVNVLGTGVDWVFGAHNEAVTGEIFEELAEATQKIMDGDLVVGYGYLGEGNISGVSWPNNPAGHPNAGQRRSVQDLVELNLGYIEWWFPSEASPTGNIRIQTSHKYGVGNVHPYASAVDREVIESELKGLKVIEILTGTSASYVGRRAVATAATTAASPTATDAQKANLQVTERNRYEGLITTSSLSLRPKRGDPPPAFSGSPSQARPRELDDYYLAGLYDLPGVPTEIHEFLVSDADATAKYGADYPKYFAFASELADQVHQGLAEGKGVFVVGSNCAPGVGVAGGVRRAFGDDVKVGLIYMDAHGDINTTQSTYSGSQGGMNVAPMSGLDRNMDPWWWSAAGGFYRPFDVTMHAGGRNLDWGPERPDGNFPSKPYERPFGEIDNMERGGVIISTVNDMNNPAKWSQQVKELSDQVDVIYLHIDFDAVDSAFGANLGTPEPGWDGDNHVRPEFSGPDIWTFMDNIKVIMETDKVAVIKLASVYTGPSMNASRINGLESIGWKYPPFVTRAEAQWELSNRYSQPQIFNAMRMVSTMLGNWDKVVLPIDSDDFNEVVMPKTPVGNVESLRVVELHSRSNAGTVGRNHVNPSNSAYHLDHVERGIGAVRNNISGGVVSGTTDTIVVDNIVRPRELDEYHRMGIYSKAGVPYTISEMRISEAEAQTKYIDNPDYPEIDWNYQAYAREVSNQVYEGLRGGNAVLVGGDRCAPVVGVAGGVRRAYGNEATIGIIYVDGHGDMNSKYTTFSGSMGGMDMAAVVGVKDPLGVEDQKDWWESAAGVGMRVFDESILATARDLDTGVDPIHGPFSELMNLESVGGEFVDTEDFCDETEWTKKVQAFADKVDVIYLHIDHDFLDPTYASNIGGNPPGGPSIWEAMRALEIVMETDKVAVVYLAAVYFGSTGSATPWPNNEFADYLGVPRGSVIYTMADFPGEAPDERANRLSTFSMLSAVRLISTMLESWENMPEVELAPRVYARVDGTPQVHFQDPIEYTLSIKEAVNVLAVDVEFVIDGGLLAAVSFETLSGFKTLEQVNWTDNGDGTFTGNVRFGFQASGADEYGYTAAPYTEIAKFVFDSQNVMGDAVFEITNIEITGFDESVGKVVYYKVIVEDGNGITKIYNVYDLNKDGIVDLLDLGIMLLYVGYTKDDPQWDTLIKTYDSKDNPITPSTCDVNGDGEVDMSDLVELMANFGLDYRN